MPRKRHGRRNDCWWLRLCGVAFTLSLLAGAGCEKQSDDNADGAGLGKGGRAIVVYTTFYPMQYFAERIGGKLVTVVCPCPPDADPAYWMPDDDTIQAFQKADLIVINGASFEKWIEKVTLPATRIVNTAEPFADDFIVLKDAVTHSHGPSGKHSHEGVDGHTWLDPVLARRQAEQILRALRKATPAHEKELNANFLALAADLDALDALHREAAPVVARQFMLCSHPAYNYVGRRYGWHLKSYHFDPDQMPDEDTVRAIQGMIEENGARLMLWERAPEPAVAARMESLGLTNVVFSPCELLEATEKAAGTDFLQKMRRNVGSLTAAAKGLPSK